MPDRVVVVGAGSLGLSCALRCSRPATASTCWRATCRWRRRRASPLRSGTPTSRYPQDKVTAWSATTYAELARLADDDATGRGDATRHRAARSSRAPDPWWVDAVPRLDRVTPAAPYADGWSFVAPVVEMPRYLAGYGPRRGGRRHVTRMALAQPARGAAGGELLRPRVASPRGDPLADARARAGGRGRAGRTGRVVARRGRPDVRDPAQPATSCSAVPTTRGSGPAASISTSPPTSCVAPRSGPRARRGARAPAQGRPTPRSTGDPARAGRRRDPLLRPWRRRRHPLVGLRRRGRGARLSGQRATESCCQVGIPRMVSSDMPLTRDPCAMSTPP